MFNFWEMAKQVGAAGAVGFGSALTAALLGDVSGATAAAHAGYGAAVGVGLGLLGNLAKQILDRARGYLRIGVDEASILMAEIIKKAVSVRKMLG